MQVKLIATCLVAMLLCTTAGCLWLHPTRFTLLSSTVADNNGFPALALSFNLTDDATVTLTDPAGRLCYTKEFFEGNSSITAFLGGFRTSPVAGSYTLLIKDAGKNTVYTRTFQWSAPFVSLLSCSQQWFRHSNETVLSLSISVENTGQLPFYPDQVRVLYSSTVASGPVVPCTILPGKTANVNALLVMPSDLSLKTMTVQLLDVSGAVAGSMSQNVSNGLCPSLQFSWYYQGHQQLTLPNASALYLYDCSLPREPTEDYAVYVFNSLDDALFTYVVHRILALCTSGDSIARLNFIAGFVQALEYRADDPTNASVEYPRYPIETLNEQGGDCEDKAILCAELLYLAGYNVSLLRLPDHMAVGVHLQHLEGYTPFTDSYYFLEATAEFSPVGRIPSEYQGNVNYTVYTISQRPLVLHEWLDATRYTTSRDDYVQLDILVKNLGSARAPVDVQAFFQASSIRYGTQYEVLPSLEAGGEAVVSLNVNVPKGVATVLKTQVLVNGTVQQEKESATIFQ